MASQGPMHCDICDVNLKNENDRKLHLNSKKHVRLEEQKRSVTCGVFITGFPNGKSKDELLSYFSKFGSIFKAHVGPKLNYIILVYENEREAETVLKRTHFIDNVKLLVERRNSNVIFGFNTKNDGWEEDSKRMIEKIENIPSFDQQVIEFVKMMTPHIPSVLPIYHRVNVDMAVALNSEFPGCWVHPFGSTVSSLQFKNSDIDIFVRINQKEENEDIKYLNRARKALLRCKTFSNVLKIPSAKIPILKCIHNQTGVKCDVNFRNMLGVKNSELIKFHLSCNNKLREAMLVIKFWGKIHGISGRNHLFTNYSLVMMFLFYLQLKFSLPSVHTLQENTFPEDPQVIWNMSFNTKEHLFNCCENFGLLSILKGFFLFYYQFQYDLNIVCPYIGEVVEKNLFSNSETVPEKFVLYKKHVGTFECLKHDKPICVQDPFEHNINVCSNILQNVLEKYVNMCGLAVEILSKDSEEKMLFKLFTNIFERKIPQAIAQKPEDYFELTIEMRNKGEYLKRRVGNEGDEEQLIDVWFKECCEFLYKMFDEIFKFTLTSVDTSSKSAKIDDQKDIHDCEHSEKYKAVCISNMWDYRVVNMKAVEEKIRECKTNLDKEIAISDFMWNRNPELRPSTSLFECEISMSCHRNPARVKIEMRQINSYKKMFKTFAIYFSNKIPAWFDLHEIDLNKMVC